MPTMELRHPSQLSDPGDQATEMERPSVGQLKDLSMEPGYPSKLPDLEDKAMEMEHSSTGQLPDPGNIAME